jgi:hypothetical protein
MRWGRRKDEEEAEETTRLVRHAAELHGVAASEVADAVLGDDDEDEPEEPRRRFRAGLWVTLGLIGGVFGLGIVGLMKLANMADKAGPAAVSGIAQLNASIAPTPQPDSTYRGTYIVFNYPGAFDQMTHPASLANTADQFGLSSRGDYHKSIMVYVEKEATPTGDSGYQWRNMNKAEYTPNPVKIMGEPATVMVKSDQSERTLYWFHSGYLVIVSATGEPGNIPAWMSTITGSLRWLP